MEFSKSRPEKEPAKPVSRRRLLASAGAAALTLTLPRFVDAQSLEPRHDVHSRLLLANIGQSRQSGSNWLRSWLAGLMHEPEARLQGIVLHGPPGSEKSSFTRAVGGLQDGFVVTHERALLEYAYLGKRLIAWEGQVLGTIAREATVEHCLYRIDDKPRHSVRCETLGGELVSNIDHPNLMHWIETGTRPSPQSVARACVSLSTNLAGPCRYHAEFEPKGYATVGSP
jgi:hypothetical protein